MALLRRLGCSVLAMSCGSVTAETRDANVEIDGTTEPRADACTATAEVLDGTDDDCDGKVDEGFWTTVVVTSPATLAARDGGCGGPAQITANAFACHRAAVRECRARGYPAGFRPVEVSATEVAFGCVADVTRFADVAYAELATYVPDCSPADGFRGQCFTAIKRFCQAKGFATGIGPVNDDPSTSVELVCTRHATPASLTFAELRQRDPACDLPASANPWDFACFRAYHRACWQAGATSAWGPLEYNQVDRYIDLACLVAQ